jgi:hypothetical protein
MLESEVKEDELNYIDMKVMKVFLMYELKEHDV